MDQLRIFYSKLSLQQDELTVEEKDMDSHAEKLQAPDLKLLSKK